MKINYSKFMNLSKSDACIWCTKSEDELKVDKDDPLFYMLVIGFLNWFDSVKGYETAILTYPQLKNMFNLLNSTTIKKILQQHRFGLIKEHLKQKFDRRGILFHVTESQADLMTGQNIFKGLVRERIIIHFWNYLLLSTYLRPPFLVKEGIADERLLRRTFYQLLDEFLRKQKK